MKITARVNGENQQLVNDLTQRGIVAKLVKGGVIIELPKRENGSYKDPGTFDIPEEVGDAQLSIGVSESGGGMTNTGSGNVVCGLSGKPLRPYYVPKGGHLANETHAYFSVPNAVVTVTGYRRDDEVVIEEFRIVRDGNVAKIESKTIWSGDLDDLPKSFSHYADAAKAAHRKANCYHCRCVHFAAIKEN